MAVIDDFDYEAAEELLADADVEVSASELQGIICGMMSAGQKFANNQWQTSILEVASDSGEMPTAVLDSMHQLALWTQQEMRQQDSLAPMLLPDDSYPTVDQLEAIVFWTQGFLLGFGLEIGDQPIESKDVKEAINDIAEISQLAIDADDDEETQIALTTVIEHLRVAVQVIYLDTVVANKKPEMVPEDETLH